MPGLGRLVKAHRKARVGRNPQTGEPIQIKEDGSEVPRRQGRQRRDRTQEVVSLSLEDELEGRPGAGLWFCVGNLEALKL